ncbi:hypothetical protein J4221_00475 [Candidatus Pacearchaeota archaeon]|nr:hypothetical protein [Candidatus Pacearchaeota archaeon]
MGKGIVTVVIALIVIVGVLFFIFNNYNSKGGTSDTQERLRLNEEESSVNVPSVSEVSENEKSYTIEINNGFSPGRLEINKGDTVTFVNNGDENSWPASAVHPSHKVYPGSDIAKCGTAAIIFDACDPGLSKGESFSFTFNEVGEWKYHDHLNPSLNGVIVVKG